jgi:hypothetical protein
MDSPATATTAELPGPVPEGAAEAPDLSKLPRYPVGERTNLIFTTLGEAGQVLPIGVLGPDGRRTRDFELRNFTFSEEQEIADIQDKNKALTVSGLTSEILALLVTRVGHVDFRPMSTDARKAFLAGMFMPDVLQIYVCLRRVTMGPMLTVKIKCLNCERQFDAEFNLDEMPVRLLGPTTPLQIQWHVELQEGLRKKTRAGERLVKGLWVRPMYWGGMVAISGGISAGARKAETLRQGLVDGEPTLSVGGEPVPFADADLKTVGKFDYEKLVASLEDDTPGPQLVLETICPSPTCRFNLIQPINWFYDSFFRFSRPSREPSRN